MEKHTDPMAMWRLPRWLAEPTLELNREWNRNVGLEINIIWNEEYSFIWLYVKLELGNPPGRFWEGALYDRIYLEFSLDLIFVT